MQAGNPLSGFFPRRYAQIYSIGGISVMQANSAADTKRPISAEFAYAENYANLYGSRLHYVDVGQGDPFLFLHGNPHWSYCWRNVIPHLEPLGRCIAPDFIGFGKSDHPDIEYRIFDQIRFIEEFVVQLDLRNITLVLHDWGALVGLDVARRFPERIRGVAFFEFPVKPPGTLKETWPLIADEFEKLRSPETGPELLMGQNLIVESTIPAVTLRKLSEEEMNQYRAPFPDWESRRPMARLPRDWPFGGEPIDTAWVIAKYSEWLIESPIPKLLIHATPGLFVTPENAAWAASNFKNIDTLDLGPGVFMLMEDHPHEIGEGIVKWFEAKVA
ncbi:haloalkane dehalogenase [Paraburkholderia sp. GAS334]|uniref:haloalkane dehalogenase n=1 Tax=unclassified Paraburkholderia TaxID=2615204 RepID=UPI003D2004CB